MICLILAERGFWQCKSLTKSLSRSLNIIWKNRWNLLLTIKFKTHNFFLSFDGLTYCKSVGRKLVSIKFEIVRISVTLTFTVIHFYPVTDLFTLHSIYVYAILRWKCRKKSPDFRRIEQPEASLRRTRTYNISVNTFISNSIDYSYLSNRSWQGTHTHTHTSWRGEAACSWHSARSGNICRTQQQQHRSNQCKQVHMCRCVREQWSPIKRNILLLWCTRSTMRLWKSNLFIFICNSRLTVYKSTCCQRNLLPVLQAHATQRWETTSQILFSHYICSPKHFYYLNGTRQLHFEEL